MSWEKFTSIITNRVFPSIRILHPLPCYRFDAGTRGKMLDYQVKQVTAYFLSFRK